MSGRRLPFGMIFSSSRGENSINFSTLGVGAHSRSIRNRVIRHVFNDPSLNYSSPDILCKPISGIELVINVSGTLILSEDYASGTFTVALNKAPLMDTKVLLVVNDPTEAEVSVNEIIFTPQNFYKPVTVTVTGKDDTIIDGTINTFVRISLFGEDAEKSKFVYVANEDNDGIEMLIITGVNNLRFDTDEGILSEHIVNFKMAYEPNVETIFNIVTNSANIISSTNTLVYDSTNWNISQPITFTLNKPDDNIAGGDITENITITYTDPELNNVTYTKIINVIFSDDDVLESNVNSGESFLYEDTTLAVDISLNKEPVSDVNLLIFSSDNTRVTVDPTNLIFTTENYNTEQRITLNGINNGIIDAPGTVDISLTFVGGGNENITYTSQKKFTVALYDAIKQILTESSAITMDEGSNLNFDISLSTRPLQNIRLDFTSASELKPITPLTFTNVNWNTPQTITLESNLSFSANDQTDILAITADADFGTINLPVTVRNVFNSINITFSNTTFDVEEGGLSNTFDLSLNSQPTDNVILSFVLSATGYNSSDLKFDNISDVTIAPANWNQPNTITLNYPNEDTIYNDISVNLNVIATSNDSDYNNLTKTILINLLNTGILVYELLFSNNNFDINEGSSDTFDLSLSSPPTSSVTLTFSFSAFDYSPSDLSFSTISDLTITTDDWNANKTITINYPDVDRYYNDISVNFNILTASTDTNYDAISKDLFINLYNIDIPLIDLSRNINVSVSDDGSGNKFYIDDDNDTTVEYAPTLTLHQGSAYRFTQDDTSNSSHQLRISETYDGIHSNGSEYFNGTKYKGTANSPEFTEFVVPTDNTLDKLYYYCVNHSGMGGNILLARITGDGLGYYFNVTVVDGVFYINGFSQGTIVLVPGVTYYFNQEDTSNYDHPIKFATVEDGTALVSEFEKWNIADNTGSAGSDLITYITIDAAYNGSNIFYACQNHTGMGGSIKYLR